MNEELRNLLERIFVKCRAADRPNQTILSLTKRDGELFLIAFNVRVIADAATPSPPPTVHHPRVQSTMAESIAEQIEGH